MVNNKKEKLFSEFPPVSTQQWEEVIATDLKGADYERKLVWRSGEGFNVRPYYRAQDLKAIPFLENPAGSFPFVRGICKSNQWKVHQTIGVKDPQKANSEAIAAINAGCDSIGFNLCEEISDAGLDMLLKGVVLGDVEVLFQGKAVRKVAEMMLPRIEKLSIEPKKVRISFVIDPIIKKLSLEGAFDCCEDGSKCFGRIAELVKKYAKYSKVRIVGVNGHYFHNSGSSIVQELAFTLAAGHEYLVRLIEGGLTADKAAKTIRFSMAVSSNYFMEIAKFRAARMLWANIVKGYNPEKGCSAKMFAHAVTSRWNQTVYDPYVNMLRGTTEAMSATIAGVHSLEVLPFDDSFETPTDFSSRIARNVQLLLKHESHFDQVSDASGGSYYIETLTNSIADEAWKLFRQVEDRGGYIAAFKEGFITGAIEASAAAKDKAVATRRIVLLGANQYPNFAEVADKAVTEKDVKPAGCDPDCKCAEGGECTCGSDGSDCDCKNGGKCTCGSDGSDCDCKNGGKCTCGKIILRPYRGAMPFEQIRLRADRSGKAPLAFMLTCGTLSMARARAQFACNFFACAGIRTQDNTFFGSVEQGVKAALAAKADIVVICSSDDDYATLALEAKRLLGDKAILVVAGTPASQSELEAEGITNFISVKSNVLDTLKSYLNELGI